MRLPSQVRRHAAVLLVLAGAGLLGAGTGGLGRVDRTLAAATAPAGAHASHHHGDVVHRVPVSWRGDRWDRH